MYNVFGVLINVFIRLKGRLKLFVTLKTSFRAKRLVS